MNIKAAPMGPYQTNCYIVEKDGIEVIIDPGVDAVSWVMDNVKNPKAILNTHGHFDHVWSNSELKQKLNLPVYCPKGDCFMLEKDPFSHGTPPSKADVEVNEDETFVFDTIEVKFHHFPGHTPGCSAIEIEDNLFSGDFIFQGSIGRVDFPFSNPQDMKKSINKVLKWDKDFIIYPGHGNMTTLENEKKSLVNWLNYL
ncbi:MAG: MBL fold metallo-hydrolase [Campylobacterota bacterium]|nr:MBL fold metallo-hydrolase [Campylobacterota bacterium]